MMKNAFSNLAQVVGMTFGPEAYTRSKQMQADKKRQNAFAQAGELYNSGDFKGASSALMPYDMGAGIQLAEYGQKQDDTAKQETMRRTYEGLKQLSQLTDYESRMKHAQFLSQELGIPAPTDPNDVSDHEIQKHLQLLEIQGGFGSDTKPYTLAPGAVRFGADNQVVASNPKPVGEDTATFGTSLQEVIGPDGKPMFVRTDNQGGIHPVEGYTPTPDSSGATSDRVQSTFVDADGNLQLVMRDGTIRPSGMGVQNPFQITDVGGVPTAINRRTGEGITISTPEEVGGNQATIETITENETARREAERELPKTIEAAQRSIDRVNTLINHPGLDWRYGLSSAGGLRPAVPDTPEAEAQALIEEITGGAFLQAFETLKGGGQITEIEGQKATAAITRLQNQSISKEAAIRAANDYIEVIQKGIERAKAEAGSAYAPQPQGAAPLKYNPETGDFE